jgi:hypothetical protein
MSTPTAPPPGSTTTSSPAAGVFPASAIAIRTPPARGRAVPWTRLAWVTWRQHRTMLAGAAALLGALSLYLLIMGLKIHGAYAKVASCHPAASAHCQSLANAFRHAYYGGQSGSVVTSGLNAQTIPFLLLAVPVLLGVFAGAPLLAREFESGTVRFAWTQGCGRVRWTITKLVLLAAVLTAAAEAFSLLFSWYFHPFLADGQTGQFPMQLFGTSGVDFAAWTLAAFAIGAFAGALIRRTVPAMAAALATCTVLDVVTMMSLRQRYQAPLSSRGANLPAGNTAWVLSNWYTGPNGKVQSQQAINNLIQHAPARVQRSLNPNSLEAWLSQRHYTQWWSYDPQSRFWHFQLIEGGWLLALSVILIAATVWLVRRRAA